MRNTRWSDPHSLAFINVTELGCVTVKTEVIQLQSGKASGIPAGGHGSVMAGRNFKGRQRTTTLNTSHTALLAVSLLCNTYAFPDKTFSVLVECFSQTYFSLEQHWRHVLHKNDLGGVITTPLIIFFSTHQMKDARLEKNAKNRSIREKNALASSCSPLQDCADRFIKYNYICRSLHALPTTPRRHGGALVGLAPRNKAPSSPKLKHYKSEEFLSIFRMSSSPRKRKCPPT